MDNLFTPETDVADSCVSFDVEFVNSLFTPEIASADNCLYLEVDVVDSLLTPTIDSADNFVHFEAYLYNMYLPLQFIRQTMLFPSRLIL